LEHTPNFSRRAGRTLEEAFRAFSDPLLVAKADRYASARPPVVGWVLGEPKTPYEIAHDEYWRIRRPLEDALLERLKSGELCAIGFEVPASASSTQELINPQLWHVLVPKFDDSTAAGAGLNLVDILVFDSTEMRLATKIDDDTSIAAAYEPISIVANRDYSVVVLGEVEFKFGQLQAAVVKALHGASRTDDPWRNGKALLAETRAQTRSLGDLFRRHQNWRLLIETYRGMYRLRNQRT
jgi:hypothetical protein